MGALLFGAGSVLLVLPLIGIVGLLVVLAIQRDDDPDLNRAPAIYAALVAFVALLALLIAVTGAVSAIVDFSKDTYGEGHHAEASALVAAAITAVVAIGVLVLHAEAFTRMRNAGGAAARVHRAYALVMCLVTLLLAAAAAGAAVYQVFRFISPSTFGGLDRGQALRSFVPAVVLLLGAAGLWQWHWRDAGLSAADAP